MYNIQVYAHIYLCEPETRGSVDLSVILPLIMMSIVVAMNSSQIWYLRRIKNTHDAFTYLPFLYNQAIADLLIGISYLNAIFANVALTDRNRDLCRVFVGVLLLVHRITDVVSMVTLVVFTMMKMVAVVCNIIVSHKTSWKINIGQWVFWSIFLSCRQFLHVLHKRKESGRAILVNAVFGVLVVFTIAIGYLIICI